MAKTHRLYFLKHLTNNDWNDLYHSSNSFLFSLKNTYLKKIQENASYKKSKNLIFFETLLEYQDWITTKIEDLENILSAEIEKIHTLDNFSKDLDSFLKQVDDFLAKQKLIEYSSEYEKQNGLLHYYSLNKENQLTDKKLKSIEKMLTKNKNALDSSLSIEKYHFYNKKASILKYKKVEDFPLYIEKAFNSLNDFYISNVYKNACASIITILNYKTDIKPRELPIFPQQLITDEICRCYYNAYQILLNIFNNEHQFIALENVQNLLNSIKNFEVNDIYSIEDIKTLYQIKLIICVHLLGHNQSFAEEFKTTLEEMVAKNIIFESNIIEGRLFKKVLEIYSVCGFKNEAELFLRSIS